jgi:hypothetical protein
MNRRFTIVRLASCLLLSVFATATATAADPAVPVSPPVRDGDRIRFGVVVAHPPTRKVYFPAILNQTSGLVEYAVVTDYGKTHESLLVTTALPMDVQSALLLLRARPSGTNGLATGTTRVPAGSGIQARVLWTSPSGTSTSAPLSQCFALTKGGAQTAITGSLKSGPWLFNGSMITPEGFGAHFEGSIIALIHDPIAILNNPGPDRDNDDIHIPAADQLPPLKTEVTVELTVEPP